MLGTTPKTRPVSGSWAPLPSNCRTCNKFWTVAECPALLSWLEIPYCRVNKTPRWKGIFLYGQRL